MNLNKYIPVLVCGTRTFDMGLLFHYVMGPRILPIIRKIVIVTGDCPTGADLLIKFFARYYGIPLKVFEADWGTYGKAAGPYRNAEMAEWVQVHPRYTEAFGFAFWDGESRGTANMIDECLLRGINIHVERYLDRDCYFSKLFMDAQDKFKPYRV